MPAIARRLVIGFGSESGNAQALAYSLACNPLWKDATGPVHELNALSLSQMDKEDLLVIVSSSFGDGEPPANAEQFLARVQQSDALHGLRYVLFGLGDTGYPNFCGFTKQLDAALQERGAQALIPRVDADTDYADFFTQWQAGLMQVWQGQLEAGAQLMLRVTAYGEDNAFAAPVLERKCLSLPAPDGCESECAAHHIRLDVRGSGMAWRAGDTLHVLAKNEPQLLAAIACWLGDAEAIHALQTKELRLISKTVLREIAGKTGHVTLKELLKFSKRKELDAYLFGADILDILEDFATPGQIHLDDLLQWLSPRLPRAYSIASPGASDYLDLCIREIRHSHRDRQRNGMATHWLLNATEPIQVYCRSNPGFHLPQDVQAPLILIGTGTGIAPLIGLLREMQAKGQHRRVCLVFGEKRSNHDFLYREELQALQASAALECLITAFSRDGDSKYYVQHAIAEHGEQLRALVDSGAHIYVCGNKTHLEKAVAGALNALYVSVLSQGPSDQTVLDETDKTPAVLWPSLQAQGRIHQELY
ncbi:sulfite reductase flavoprotein subunit alpha [Lampropedia puyangensis]|uniref:NADPH--hemoprotein reductase n=1 Tax=Lampropedia puyangensis TaxID=1330072 RepID=A0A4S8EUM1_9BURK|nr:sulfite reductase flavoprotein subunit alpha [Lampropedia puyangensis]THT98442.1 sulfite reductase flavoprotein subunit alpha [Lampropedia puyangensis]